MKAQQERAQKQAGTKDGKALHVYKEKYIENLNYRYESELDIIVTDDKMTKENKDKAKQLLEDFDNELKELKNFDKRYFIRYNISGKK